MDRKSYIGYKVRKLKFYLIFVGFGNSSGYELLPERFFPFLSRQLHKAKRRHIHHRSLHRVGLHGAFKRLHQKRSILRGAHIDEIHDDDPGKNPAAKKYDEVTIDEVIAKNLQVVDMTASILARDNKMPMWVFGLNEENSVVNTVKGKFTGTKVLV